MRNYELLMEIYSIIHDDDPHPRARIRQLLEKERPEFKTKEWNQQDVGIDY